MVKERMVVGSYKVKVIFVSVLSLVLILVLNCGYSSNDDDKVERTFTVPQVDRLYYDELIVDKTYYIDNGNIDAHDDNPGTRESPWLTFQPAFDIIAARTKVIVMEGTYNGQVEINRGGDETGYAIFEASGDVVVNSFSLKADYLAIHGFTIEAIPETNGGYGNGGFWLFADNLYVINNTITNFDKASAIKARGYEFDNGKNIQIENNKIYGCNSGIMISGTNWLVVDNDIERLIRNPDGGGDADYMRFFGRNIIIEGNYLHGTIEEEIGESHTDGFQTYFVNDSIAKNVLIQNNFLKDYFSQGLIIAGSGDSHSNIIVRGNVFADCSNWGICPFGIVDLYVINNTFHNLKMHSVRLRKSHPDAPIAVVTNAVIKNNIFSHCSSYSKEEGCRFDNGYNLMYPADTTPDFVAATDILYQDPLFTDPDNIVGPDGLPFTDDDGLILQQGSPAIGAGEEGENIGAY